MDNDTAIKRDRDREISKANDALRLDPRKLVEEIFVNSNSKALSDSGLISRPLAYFAALIAQLSGKADAAASANARLQKTMVWLTVAIFLLTAVMVIGMGYQIFLMNR